MKYLSCLACSFGKRLEKDALKMTAAHKQRLLFISNSSATFLHHHFSLAEVMREEMAVRVAVPCALVAAMAMWFPFALSPKLIGAITATIQHVLTDVSITLCG